MNTKHTFVTLVACMDGRQIKQLIEFVEWLFSYSTTAVDTITGRGRIVRVQDDYKVTNMLLYNDCIEDINVSVENHASRGIAIAAHDECAGNPTEAQRQHTELCAAVEILRELYPDIPVVGIWVPSDTWRPEVLIMDDRVPAK
ncbi:MAG: hypothetical protein HKM24_03350, partial [Gammaproteobacteria bacterium]|nr:hypothetical protein [Gammaproteobacteria bacterium]